jgi:ketosteroid isomerase-like protein
MSSCDTVRAAFEAYLAQDHIAAERLYASDFTFTSPQDDHIDRTAFLRRCFPTADRLVSQTLLQVAELPGGNVFVLYEYELKSGERHRNVELITVHGGQLTQTQVFFGGKVS